MKKLYIPAITEDKLYEAALRYLQRYSSGAENLKRVLERRVMRFELRSKNKAPKEVALWIANAVAKCQKFGYIDDSSFAEQKVQSLRRQGRSRNYILRSLQLKGIDKQTIQKFLPKDEDDELEAAIRYVSRRRLKNDGDFAQRQKTLAKIVRAGFSPDVAKKALDKNSRA